MKRNELRAQVAIAVRACQEKKAADISILRLDEQASGFTDYFVVCSGANPRQVQAIADEVDEKLSATGVEPSHREGLQPGRLGPAGLRGLRGPHLLRERAEVLRPGAAVEDSHAAATLRSGEACPQTRCEEGHYSCQGGEGCQSGSEVRCQDRSQARPNHALAQELLSREASHRMDRQDPQFAHSIVDRRISEAALALRRLRCAGACLRSSSAQAGGKKHQP